MVVDANSKDDDDDDGEEDFDVPPSVLTGLCRESFLVLARDSQFVGMLNNFR